MRIGVPAEIKNNEHRVGLTPESVYELCSAGLAVNIQSQAGSAIGFTDQDYQQSGATILSSASDVYESSDLIVKVKELSLIHISEPTRPRLISYAVF